MEEMTKRELAFCYIYRQEVQKQNSKSQVKLFLDSTEVEDGRTVGCLRQTANENRFARFFNNRNITPVPADIRKEEEKLILLFTLHPIAGNAFI